MRPSIPELQQAAFAADHAWQRALNAAGVDRYAPESSRGAFAPLYLAKLATYDAFRAAAFPHAAR